MKYSFNDIIDGLTYWILKIEPEVKLEDAIRNYWLTITKKGIDDPGYDQFFETFISMKEIRNAEPEEQEALLFAISKGQPPVILKDYEC